VCWFYLFPHNIAGLYLREKGKKIIKTILQISAAETVGSGRNKSKRNKKSPDLGHFPNCGFAQPVVG
jgi:hypothetical protein